MRYLPITSQTPEEIPDTVLRNQYSVHLLLTFSPATALTPPARAQFGGLPGYGGGYGGATESPYSADAGTGGDGDNAGGDGGQDYGYDSAARARAAHGVLACLAFVILFPLGAVSLRVIPGRWSYHAHWVVQMLAWVLYVAAFALGVDLVRGTGFPGGIGEFVSVLSYSKFHAVVYGRREWCGKGTRARKESAMADRNADVEPLHKPPSHNRHRGPHPPPHPALTWHHAPSKLQGPPAAHPVLTPAHLGRPGRCHPRNRQRRPWVAARRRGGHPEAGIHDNCGYLWGYVDGYGGAE